MIALAAVQVAVLGEVEVETRSGELAGGRPGEGIVARSGNSIGKSAYAMPSFDAGKIFRLA